MTTTRVKVIFAYHRSPKHLTSHASGNGSLTANRSGTPDVYKKLLHWTDLDLRAPKEVKRIVYATFWGCFGPSLSFNETGMLGAGDGGGGGGGGRLIATDQEPNWTSKS